MHRGFVPLLPVLHYPLPRRHLCLIPLGHLHPHRRPPAQSPVPPRLSRLPHRRPTLAVTQFHSKTKTKAKPPPSSLPNSNSFPFLQLPPTAHLPPKNPHVGLASKLVAYIMLSRPTPRNISCGGGAYPCGALRAACGEGDMSGVG